MYVHRHCVNTQTAINTNLEFSNPKKKRTSDFVIDDDSVDSHHTGEKHKKTSRWLHTSGVIDCEKSDSLKDHLH
jgi:hypothetical protein